MDTGHLHNYNALKLTLLCVGLKNLAFRFHCRYAVRNKKTVTTIFHSWHIFIELVLYSLYNSFYNNMTLCY